MSGGALRLQCPCALPFLFLFVIVPHVSAHDLIICKQSNATRPVSGAFAFTISNYPGSISVQAGTCSSAIQLPAGEVVVTEAPSAATLISRITACIPNPQSSSEDIENCERLVPGPDTDVTRRTARVRIVEHPPATTLTFENAAVSAPGSGALVICKEPSPVLPPTGSYSFEVTPTGGSRIPVTVAV